MIDKNRWEQVESIYHAVLANPPENLAAFLEEACGGDAEVQREVESLLKFDGPAEAFIETPAVEIAARAMAADNTPPGTAEAIEDIGPYHLLSIIGQGGTGDVYLAVDTRLDRKVAIKLLSSDFTEDADLVSRFKQEARTTSSLNHPNIVTIFEIGEVDRRHYIVTEFVEGQTLRARLSMPAARPISVKETLSIATQIVDALDTAHQAGIIHRDMKPENIIIRKDGLVKVLDFGIAKLAPSGPAFRADHLTTRTGIVMGTASYMSPEQARGQKVDHRTDIFSVGVMLYEMLSGRKPFEGDTWSDVMAAVLIKEPIRLELIAPRVPPALQGIVERCLEKTPEKRFQSASDLAFALRQLSASIAADEIKASEAPGVEAPSRWSNSRRVALLISLIVATVVLGGFLLLKFFPLSKDQTSKDPKRPRPAVVGSPSSKNRLIWFDRSGKQLSSVGEPAEYSGPAFSPNEDRIVVAMNDPQANSRDLWILSPNSNESSRLTIEPSDDLNALWSSDGKWIFYTSEKNGIRNIYRKQADGSGAVDAVLSSSTEEMNLEDISRDDRFLVFNVRSKGSQDPSLAILSLATGKRSMFVSTSSRAARFSPDRRWIAYESTSDGSPRIVVRGVGAKGEPAKEEYPISNGKNGTTPMWRGDGKELFYIEGRTLMSVLIKTDGKRFFAAQPTPLFIADLEDQERRNRYVVTRNGERFLVIVKDIERPGGN